MARFPCSSYWPDLRAICVHDLALCGACSLRHLLPRNWLRTMSSSLYKPLVRACISYVDLRTYCTVTYVRSYFQRGCTCTSKSTESPRDSRSHGRLVAAQPRRHLYIYMPPIYIERPPTEGTGKLLISFFLFIILRFIYLKNYFNNLVY